MAVAGVRMPPLAVVAAMLRASIKATAGKLAAAGLEPSRLGKLRVVWRMDSAPLAGTSPAPKQGPQKAVRMVAPLAIRSVRTPVRASSIMMGLAAGVNAEGVVAAAAGMVALEDGGGLIDAVEQAAPQPAMTPPIHPELSVFDLAAQHPA